MLLQKGKGDISSASSDSEDLKAGMYGNPAMKHGTSPIYAADNDSLRDTIKTTVRISARAVLKQPSLNACNVDSS